jgi:hypothetical protein
MWLLSLLFYKQIFFYFYGRSPQVETKAPFLFSRKCEICIISFILRKFHELPFLQVFAEINITFSISQNFRENDLTFCVFVKNFAKIVQSLAAANLFLLPKMATLFQILLTSLPFFYNNRKENTTLPNCHANCCKDLRENFRHFRMFLKAIIFTFSQKFKK